MADDVDKYIYFYRGEDVPEAITRIFEGYDRFIEKLDYVGLTNPAICGGACRSWVFGEEPRDLDMYLTKNEDHESIQADDDGTSAVIKITALGGNPIEIINFVYKDLESVLNTFDMTVAMCGVDKEQLVCHKDYIADLASKSIVFSNLNKPMNTLMRLQKYVNYGFTAHPRELTQLAQAFYLMDKAPEMPDFARDPVTGHFVIRYNTGVSAAPLQPF